ncbi:chloride channel E isoform X2 [Wolffia australiana]
MAALHRWISTPALSCSKLSSLDGHGAPCSLLSSLSAPSSTRVQRIRHRHRIGRGSSSHGVRSDQSGVSETSKPSNGDGIEEEDGSNGVIIAVEESLPFVDPNIVAACVIGLLTGISVVLFNNAVHGIRDFFWEGAAFQGTSFLREEPIAERWQRVILVPVCGGVIVSLLNKLRDLLEEEGSYGGPLSSAKEMGKPLLKAMAASVTLGTGNSLGPEGPSVEIGASIAKGVGALLTKGGGRTLSLVAAGSAAGIASGFNAAVGGCFFAVESVLWPSAEESSSSVTNTTSVVILSAVIASVISEVGLGSDPAFTVPEYDFRSPSELPLYLLLGILCGVVSLALSKCTSFALSMVDQVQRKTGAPKTIFPAFGGLAVGLLALGYPEVLYWGFENVDVLLESRPLVVGLPTGILLQLVGVKILATSLCRASGLVGGYYAPSLFIGAATGMAYGKFIDYALSGSNPLLQLHIFEVASPQAYGLVGMAATLAGVCQVPLTAVLLLFELTHDYRIVLPLLGAVGLSTLISSAKSRKNSVGNKSSKLTEAEPGQSDSVIPDLCEVESSLCVYDSQRKILVERLSVVEAMKTGFFSVKLETTLLDAVNLMFTEKQPCVMIVDEENCLVGLLTLENVSRVAESKEIQFMEEELSVSDFCLAQRGGCMVQAVTPGMNLGSAERIMDLQQANRVPVVSDAFGDRGRVIGLLDRESIEVACRARSVRDFLCGSDGSR